jgi:hypothetical protein
MPDDRHVLTSSRQFGARGVHREFGNPLAGQVGHVPDVGQGGPGQSAQKRIVNSPNSAGDRIRPAAPVDDLGENLAPWVRQLIEELADVGVVRRARPRFDPQEPGGVDLAGRQVESRGTG